MELKSIIINASKASLDMYLEDTTKLVFETCYAMAASRGACEKSFVRMKRVYEKAAHIKNICMSIKNY